MGAKGEEDVPRVDKTKAALARFMKGRNGVDKLGIATLATALLASVGGCLFRVRALCVVSLILCACALYRLLSRNIRRRRKETRRFVESNERARRSAKKGVTRLKDIWEHIRRFFG